MHAIYIHIRFHQIPAPYKQQCFVPAHTSTHRQPWLDPRHSLYDFVSQEEMNWFRKKTAVPSPCEYMYTYCTHTPSHMIMILLTTTRTGKREAHLFLLHQRISTVSVTGKSYAGLTLHDFKSYTILTSGCATHIKRISTDNLVSSHKHAHTTRLVKTRYIFLKVCHTFCNRVAY